MEEIRFKSEFVNVNELSNYPDGSYIDKTICGCGATSYLIETPIPTLLLVPTKLLVKNKVCQYPTIDGRCNYIIQGVTGDVSDEQINNYYSYCKTNNQPPKLVCTYDSFSKVLNFAKLNDVRVVVDESDTILQLVKLKNIDNEGIDVITFMLSELEKIKERVSFLSSTPVPIDYFDGTVGDWIKNLRQVKFSWENAVYVQPIMRKTSSPKKGLEREVINPILTKGEATIGGRTFKKAIIFMNSVTGICKVIKETGIKSCSSIVCSESFKVCETLKKSRLSNNRLTNYYKLPTFTFVTSVGFQGIDLYDPEAMTIIVSSCGTNDSPGKLDLNLDVKQAVSRNRIKNNPNSDTFIFYYNLDWFDRDVKVEDLVKNEISPFHDDLEKYCKGMNNGFKPEDILPKFIPLEMRVYLTNNQGLYINELIFNYDAYRLINVVNLYKKGFNVANGMSNINTFKEPIFIGTPMGSVKELSYAAIYNKYLKMLNGEKVDWEDYELDCDNYEIIKKCNDFFGKIYPRKNYAESLLDAVDDEEDVDLDSEVISKIKPGKHSCKDLKKTLQEIYDDLDINRKAKSTDIYEFYPDSSKPISTSNGSYINVR